MKLTGYQRKMMRHVLALSTELRTQAMARVDQRRDKVAELMDLERTIAQLRQRMADAPKGFPAYGSSPRIDPPSVVDQGEVQLNMFLERKAELQEDLAAIDLRIEEARAEMAPAQRFADAVLNFTGLKENGQFRGTMPPGMGGGGAGFIMTGGGA